MGDKGRKMRAPETAKDVVEWLHSIGHGQYAGVFVDQGIFGAALTGVTADGLRSAGVQSLGHRKHIIRSLDSLNGAAEPCAQSPQQSATPFGYNETYEDRKAAKSLVVEDGTETRRFMTTSGNAQSLQFAGKAETTRHAPEDRPPIPTTFVAAHEKKQTDFERFDDDGNGQLDRFEMEAMAASKERAAAEARRKALVVEDGSLERKYMTTSGNAQSLQFVGKNAAPVPRAPAISTHNQRARPISARSQKTGPATRAPSDDASTSRISTQAAMVEARYRPQSARTTTTRPHRDFHLSTYQTRWRGTATPGQVYVRYSKSTPASPYQTRFAHRTRPSSMDKVWSGPYVPRDEALG